MKTTGVALSFQHFPRDLGNVNEWKIMFDPSNGVGKIAFKGVKNHITSMGCYETSKTLMVIGLPMTKITSKGGWSNSKVPSLGGLYV